MEKICTNDKEIREVLKNSEKYLQKHGLESLILMVDSKRCESISIMKKTLKKMDDEQLINYALVLHKLLKMTRDEITRRGNNGTDC